jgi:hypothetical protein
MTTTTSRTRTMNEIITMIKITITMIKNNERMKIDEENK